MATPGRSTDTLPPLQATMVLRRATAADAAALAVFAGATFADTYRDIDDAQDIADYIAENLNQDAVAERLRQPGMTTLLAEVDATLAGYAEYGPTPAPDCVSGPAPVELARFYLRSDFIGRGYGARLMRSVMTEAWRIGGRTLWLGVYDRNLRAVRFYERFGFVKVGSKAFLFAGRSVEDPIYSIALRAEPRMLPRESERGAG